MPYLDTNPIVFLNVTHMLTSGALPMGYKPVLRLQSQSSSSPNVTIVQEQLAGSFQETNSKVIEELGTQSFWDDRARRLLRRSRMEGFLVLDYVSRFPEAIQALSGWLREGRLKQKDDVMVGLENAPKAFMHLFTGENFGKQSS